MQRDVVRQGVVDISVSFTVTALWLKKLTAYSKQNKLTVEYFDTDSLSLRETEMYIDGFKAKRVMDGGIYFEGVLISVVTFFIIKWYNNLTPLAASACASADG